MAALMSHAGPKHQQLFPRILDCCRHGIHKNAKFISQTPAMADFAYTNVGPEEAHTTFGRSQNCRNGSAEPSNDFN
jgi:hypothetical protein